jgi:hypothetical protein
MGIRKQIALLFLFEVSSSLETILKITYAYVKIPRILVLTVYLNFVNFTFQILPLSLKCLLVSALQSRVAQTTSKPDQNYFPINGDDLVE